MILSRLSEPGAQPVKMTSRTLKGTSIGNKYSGASYERNLDHLPRIDPEWHDYASEWIIYVMKNVTYIKNGLFRESESTDIGSVRRHAAYGQAAP
jgi:hypothetical protein